MLNFCLQTFFHVYFEGSVHMLRGHVTEDDIIANVLNGISVVLHVDPVLYMKYAQHPPPNLVNNPANHGDKVSLTVGCHGPHRLIQWTTMTRKVLAQLNSSGKLRVRYMAASPPPPLPSASAQLAGNIM